MVIDEGKLIALLVDKTGRSKQEVEDQLNQLKGEITQAAESGRQFHIDNFGTFGMEDGGLYFDPASQLKTEINQKYAGMKPIELMAAFKESGAGVPVEETEPESEVSPPLPEEAESEQKEPEEVKKEEQDQPESRPAEKPEKEEPKVPIPAAKEKEPKKQVAKTKQKKGSSGREKEENDTLGIVLVAAVAVIALLAAGWFLYDSGVFNSFIGDSPRAPADTTAQRTEQPSSVAAGDSAMVADAAAADSMEQNAGNNVSENSTNNTATYGLKGTLKDEAQDGYTIVIHSFRLRSTVQEIADSLSQQGYRTVLFSGEANGETRWRLGLGQFETVDQAQQAVPNLSASYRENHFIKRIQ